MSSRLSHWSLLSVVITAHGMAIMLLWSSNAAPTIQPPVALPVMQGRLIAAPAKPVAAATVAAPTPAVKPAPQPQPKVEPVVKTTPVPPIAPKPQPKPKVTPKPVPKPAPKPKPKPKPKPTVPVKPKVTPPVQAPAPVVQTQAAPTSSPVQQQAQPVSHANSPVSDDAVVAEQAAAPSVIPPRMEASALNNPPPTYPRLSRRLHEQGTVVLKILILANGRVGEIKLQQSSGFSRLDQAAIKAVKQWRYQAARRGDTPIDYWYQQAVNFTLK